MKGVKQTKTVKAFQLPIEITREGDHFIAHCPRWKDCYAQGKSIDEATTEIIAVASSLIELYQEEELSIPLVQNKSSTTSAKISFDVPIFSSV
jgi:predicted RNase H-like HicB family nuclease